MKQRTFASACIASAALMSSVRGQSYPAIYAYENDEPITLYVQYPNWANASTEGQTMTYGYNNRMYLSTSSTLDTSSYYKPNLLGGSMEYDVDLSMVSCGCVSALYTILMPAIDNTSDPFKYCDANQVGGHWCPEFDIQEANRHAFHTTAHECDAPDNGVYRNCDRGGHCTADVFYDAPGQYGTGTQYTINTERPFHVKVEFIVDDNDQFTDYRMTLTQGSNEIVMNPQGDCAGYLPAMTSDITQMVFSFSHWDGGSLDWMQHGVCSGSCQQNATQTFSNLRFYTTNINPPDNNDGGDGGDGGDNNDGTTEYTWGDPCANVTDQYCGDVDCAECLYSWPSNTTMVDPWNHWDAACRCKTESGQDNTDGGDSGPSPPPSGQYPPLVVKENGQEKTLYVQYPEWAQAATQSDELWYNFNHRMYLSESEQRDTSKYYKPNLLGGIFEYDVNLSKVSCGCVSALYTILMPAIDNTSDPFKYCDANQVGGHWCPEFDIQEANRHAFHATAHKCDQPNNGVYNSCDRGGQCTLDVFYHAQGQYGEGSQYAINTQNEFHVKTEFLEQNGQFYGYKMTMSQEDRQIVMDSGDCSNYLQHMTSDITQMVFALSHWESGNLDWMQHGVCSGSCQSTAQQVYSNLQFWTQGNSPDEEDPVPDPDEEDPVPDPDEEDPVPDPDDEVDPNPDDEVDPNPDDEVDPEPTQFTFGDVCTYLDQDDCANVDCAVCKMSWPTDTLFTPTTNDPEARCRCEIEVDPERPVPTEFEFGETCARLSDGECGEVEGCDACHQAWPVDSPFADPWKADPYSTCKCKPKSPFPEALVETQYRYGTECTKDWQDKSACRDGCQCHMSWPADQLWDSPERKCRCLPRQRAPQGYTYAENQCKNSRAGTCDGSCDCRQSWPTDDPLGSQSVEKMCRCKPAPEPTRIFGGECGDKYNALCGADCHSCRSNWLSSGSSDGQCRCPVSEIREIVWGAEKCESNFAGQCGSYCRDCRKSWELSDTDGSTIDCRCRNWWGN